MRYQSNLGYTIFINDMEKWVHAFDHQEIFAKNETMQKFLSIGKYDGKDVVVVGSLKYGFGLIHGEEVKKEKNIAL